MAVGVVRQVSLWFVCLACIAILGGHAHAQSETPTLATYEGWLREAFAAAQRGDRLGLEQVAPRLTETTAVTLPDGSTATVDNSWLRDALKASEPDLPPIASRLGALIDALALPTSPTPPDAQERLKTILSRPPFVGADAPQDSLLGRILDWLFRQLARLFRPISDASSGSANVIGWLVAGLGALLLIGGLAYVLLWTRRNLASDVRTTSDDPETRLTSNSAIQQASEMARGGDYRIAVRYMYLSALLWLDERDMLRYDRALTNREYLEHLGDNPELRGRLLPIVETFDRVWYGYASLDAQSFEAYRQQVEALRR